MRPSTLNMEAEDPSEKLVPIC